MTKYIILDIDSTMIYTSKTLLSNNTFSIVNVLDSKYYVYKRPYLDLFIKNLQSKNYNIIVWTHAMYDYGIAMTNCICSDHIPTIDIMTRDTIQTINNFKSIKVLSKKFSDIINNTLIIDDNPTVIMDDEKQYYIPIIPFKGEENDTEFIRITGEINKLENINEINSDSE